MFIFFMKNSSIFMILSMSLFYPCIAVFCHEKSPNTTLILLTLTSTILLSSAVTVCITPRFMNVWLKLCNILLKLPFMLTLLFALQDNSFLSLAPTELHIAIGWSQFLYHALVY